MAQVIPFDLCEPLLDWSALTNALSEGHLLPKAEIADSFLYRGPDTLLSRAAWIDGLGQVVKTATIFPENQDAPNINGAVTLFSDATGELEALIDFHLVTKWKTAGDSLLSAKRLARPDARNILIVGAGTVAASMIAAYSNVFLNAQFKVWARNPIRAAEFAAQNGATVAEDLPKSVGAADIICTATMTHSPIIQGDWLRPGQHLDLIGAYRPDMREVDDACLKRSRLFVDCIETTLDHIGELKIPLSRGVISKDNIVADFYKPDLYTRQSDDDITIAKNGGGAHLDLMTCRYIMEAWSAG